jgi:biopolymer transport protein ExbD
MARKQPATLAVNMTPMIDVVFNLLLFFILTTEFMKATIVRLELPQPIARVIPPPPNEARAIVNVSQVNGLIETIAAEGRTWSPESFPDLLRQLRASRGENLEIELRADKRLKWSAVATIMQDCADLKIRKMHFVGKQ